MVAPTRKEEGCLCYNLHVSTRNPADFMFYEQWASQESLAAHGMTGHMQAMREATRGKMGGRTLEIQRLIGRSLRAVVDRKKMGERTVWLDCDVIQADGGTRTAAITGAYTALVLASAKMYEKGWVNVPFLTDQVAATSVGMVDGKPLLDLAYTEDSAADVDLNVVRTGAGAYVEVQGTAEQVAFPRDVLNNLLDLADKGIDDLLALQREVLGEHLDKALQPAGRPVSAR